MEITKEHLSNPEEDSPFLPMLKVAFKNITLQPDVKISLSKSGEVVLEHPSGHSTRTLYRNAQDAFTQDVYDKINQTAYQGFIVLHDKKVTTTVKTVFGKDK